MVHTGRVEFTSFLPENTQAAIIQPIGRQGVLIAASNTQRGITRLDQVHLPHHANTCMILACLHVQYKRKKRTRKERATLMGNHVGSLGL